MKQKRLCMGCLASLLLSAFMPRVVALGPGDVLTGVGQVVAIELETDGVIVAGFAQVDTENGSVSPGAEAGLQPGDRILALNDRQIHDDESLLRALAESEGSVRLEIERKGSESFVELNPALGKDGKSYLGLWLRSGISGIGTVTFQDPVTGVYGALGHGVGDEKEESLTPIRGGAIGSAAVERVVRGESGSTGELVGIPAGDALGDVRQNSSRGIFGVAEVMDGARYPVAAESEIALGAAEILCTVEGTAPERYRVDITRIESGCGGRSLSLRVTDEALIEKTGGIVQGMSGSPILQNGKLVGAVTHVLVEDPRRGYGITLESMLKACNGA